MKKLFLLTGLLVVALGIWIAASVIDTNAATEKETEKTAVTTEANGLEVGDKAPSFKLKNVDGTMVSPQDEAYEDVKGYTVIFTCNTCPWAQGYEDRIIELHNKLKDTYPVIAIQPNDPAAQPGDSFAEMQKRAKEKGFTFPYLMDEGQEIHPQYGATRTPEVYLLDKDMRLIYTGAIDDNARDADAVTVNYVESAIEAHEAGKPVEPTKVKAIGCTIKYVK
jgi:peroxiredoxin